MKKISILVCLAIGVISTAFSQKIQTPSEFLGYTLGEQFTPHHRVVDYYRYLAGASKNIKLQEYGKTNEGRTLLVAVVASAENMSRLDEIRKNNLLLTGIEPGQANPSQPA